MTSPRRLGAAMVGKDGLAQVMTTEEVSQTLTRALIARGVRFSLNPVTLEDIFYQAVGRRLENESEEAGD